MSNIKRTAGARSELRRALDLTATAGLAGLAGLMGLGLGAAALAAESPPSANEPQEVEGLTAMAEARRTDPKETAPPINQSQTTTVVTAATMEAQNLLTLREVLSTVPGITFGAGEGGGGYGDSITLRGFSASNDIQSDGVRDSAQYTRSDSFNLEQIEVTNGPNSVTSGAGAVGGNINLISKQPLVRDQVRIGGGLGTHSYARATIDANTLLTQTIAIRLNAMRHRNDAPGRDVEKFDRWAYAPSIKFGVGEDANLTLNYLRQHDENVPQYGVPTLNGRELPGIDRKGYYGSANRDHQVNDVESITSTFSYQGAEGLSFRNLSRWQQVRQDAVVSPPQGGFCLANGHAPATFSQTATSTGPNDPVTFTSNTTGLGACAAGLSPDTYRPGGPRGTTRNSVNEILYNQADITWRGDTGGVQHVLNAGLSFSEETYHLDSGNSFRNPGGATPNPTFADIRISNPTPDAIYNGPYNFVRTAFNDNEVRNRALYVFDTITLNPQWIVNLGARYEENQGTAVASSINVGTGVVTTSSPQRNSDTIFSFRGGLVYKPTPNASIYAGYGSSKTPSQTTVNGSCATNSCNVEPETAYNYEVGVKYQRGGLYLTAALFRNDRANYKVSDPDPLNTSGYQVNEGKARVQGVQLGASGRITPQWSVFANYSYLKSKVIQGVSDYSAALGDDFTRGDPLGNAPEHGFSLFTTYRVTPALDLGYGLTYQDEVYLSQHGGITVTCAPTACPGRQVRSTLPLQKVEGYRVSRLMASWRAPGGVDVQLNIQNLFNEDYLTNPRSGAGWANPGPARSATLTANYRF